MKPSIPLQIGYLCASLIVHLLVYQTCSLRHDFHVSPPPQLSDAVMVELAAKKELVPFSVPANRPPVVSIRPVEGAPAQDVAAAAASGSHVLEDAPPDLPRSAEPATQVLSQERNEPDTAVAESTMPAAEVQPTVKIPAILPALRHPSEFIRVTREQLTYRISLLGMPVGTAEMDARTTDGEFRITVKVKSGAVVSTVYPVDDLIEVRHLGGNFIITKIRQQEGAFRSDRGFTISLRDKSVFWIDLLRNRTATESIPTGDVLDVFSALYYLRNRELQVGRTVMLDIYDSDTYAQLPVEVLRREQISLPGGKVVPALALRPAFKTDGIFRRSGHLTVWVTDDENKVPVKVETTIALGKVTAELIAADTTPVHEATDQSLPN